jgi:hypothetical protein
MKNDGVFTSVESSERPCVRAAAKVHLPVHRDLGNTAPSRLFIASISCIIHSCNLNRTRGRLLKREGARYRTGCRHTIFQRSLYARSDFQSTCL